VIIAPSVLSADFRDLRSEVSDLVSAGADWLHVDIMDGHFVPNLSFGAEITKVFRSLCDLPLDLHLMIEEPERHIPAFVDAGADIITVHLEICPHLHRVVQQIHSCGKKAGVAINPATPACFLKEILSEIDLLLVMTVNPGWGGQSFIEASLSKLEEVAQMMAPLGESKPLLQVDGGVNEETAALLHPLGVDVLVAGSYVLGDDDRARAIGSLRG